MSSVRFGIEPNRDPAQRWIVVKCEANSQGTNRRAVVTNRPGAFVLPGAAYDDYANRGESENRNKELKCGLLADRLSDQRYMANLFRLYMHAAAYNLLARLRCLIADPPPEVEDAEVPVEALDHNAPSPAPQPPHANAIRLSEGQPCTWQTRLIKVAARVTERARRVLVELSGSWPYLEPIVR